MKIVGIVLIVLGVLALAYQGIRYTTREKLIDIGPLNVTTTERKTIPLPPIVGGAAIIAGVALILVDRKKA
jgi:drug/metabolite transporter (DMT)-like permease